MAVCISCNKKSRRISWSRHQKGSSGASEWPLRAQIIKRSQKPNLHTFEGKTYCTKCLRTAKAHFAKQYAPKTTVVEQAAA